MLYETLLIFGGALGNALDLIEFPVPVSRIPLVGEIAGQLLMAGAGLGSGVFVGCLVMSLAETVKAVPVLNRRLHLSVGIQYMILAIALGKMAGALIHLCLFSHS